MTTNATNTEKQQSTTVTATELLETLTGLETAFDKWYCDSGHLCALLDGIIKEDATDEMKDEALRLQNLLVMSIKARTLIIKAGGVL